MLIWFYNEQTEEEKNTMELRDKLKMIGDSIAALMQLDAMARGRPPAGPVPAESTAP